MSTIQQDLQKIAQIKKEYELKTCEQCGDDYPPQSMAESGLCVWCDGDNDLYSLRWVDATLMEHYKNKKALVRSHKEQGICLSEITDDGSWYDYLAEHIIRASDDQEAIKYVENYDFGGRDVDSFTLYKNGREVFTEEDFNNHYQL